MIILAIDTSCDDTCAAVVNDGKIITNVISSQVDLYKEWGGVVPNLAKRAHLDRIDKVVQRAVNKIGWDKIDVIGVTQGPGLSPALGVGVNKAKELAIKHGKKLTAINHIEGHILSPLLTNSKGKPSNDIKFPILVLTVSGGHTKIVRIAKIGKYRVVGETLDDAGGEALDKASKMMGLGYPGGPIVEKLAKKGKAEFIKLPIPMKQSKDLNMSFSGLKTAFYYTIKDWSKTKVIKNIENLSASFQKAVFDSLIFKFNKAINLYKPKSLFGTGGVMNNKTLKNELRKLARKEKLPIFFPFKKELNGDNAAMIGLVAYYKALKGGFVENLNKLDREPRMEL